MQTDILLTMQDRTLIIDTKYYTRSMQKQFDKHSIHSNNLYQMHTYVTEFDEGHKGNVDGMLLYAKTQEEITPDGQMKHKDGNTIYFRTLDLNSDFETIKNMIAEQLKVDPAEIKPESRLIEDLRADSANIMVMIMDLEDQFGITVEDDQIMKLKTVGDVAAYVAKAKG